MAAASRVGDGSADDPLVDFERKVEPIRARLGLLRARRDALAPGWRADLALVRTAAALGGAELAAESAALALGRYGAAAAHLYRPEPPSVGALARLSVRSAREALLTADAERLHADAARIRGEFLALLKAFQASGDKAPVRAIGGRLNALVAVGKEALQLDALVRARLTVASRGLDAYRARCAERPLNPGDARRLCAVPPDRNGYEQILDFYRLTSAAQFSFGRALAGAQHFTDIRRNVAILRADGCGEGARAGVEGAGAGVDVEEAEEAEGLGPCARGGVFEAYAVSGERAPGLNLRDDEPRPFRAVACADGLGDVYVRHADAEFKLVTALCVRALGVRGGGGEAERARARAYAGTVTLWSKKPLCASCSEVVFSQCKSLLPRARLRVLVDEEEEEEEGAGAAAGAALAFAGCRAALPAAADGEGRERHADPLAAAAPAADGLGVSGAAAAEPGVGSAQKRARCSC